MFCGHGELIEKFSSLAKKDALSHGYIFFGEPQIGKFSFALALANLLETGIFDAPAKTLSETIVVSCSGIDAIREISGFLWQKPLNSSKRTVIVDNAGSLTPEAQNAILKIAEEPPKHSLIILITENADNLLRPLSSRLQKIYFGKVSKKEITDFLVKSQNVPAAKADKLAEESCGRLGLALDLLNNKETEKIKLEAENFLKSSGYARSQIIKNLVEEQKESPGKLDAFFQFALVALRKNPIKNYQQIKSLLHRFFLIKSYNVNKRLQIEAVED